MLYRKELGKSIKEKKKKEQKIKDDKKIKKAEGEK